MIEDPVCIPEADRRERRQGSAAESDYTEMGELHERRHHGVRRKERAGLGPPD